MQYIISFNAFFQFTQLIHYPPLVFYHFIVLCIHDCIYMFLTASWCISLFAYAVAIFLWLQDINGCTYGFTYLTE